MKLFIQNCVRLTKLMYTVLVNGLSRDYYISGKYIKFQSSWLIMVKRWINVQD